MNELEAWRATGRRALRVARQQWPARRGAVGNVLALGALVGTALLAPYHPLAGSPRAPWQRPAGVWRHASHAPLPPWAERHRHTWSGRNRVAPAPVPPGAPRAPQPPAPAPAPEPPLPAPPPSLPEAPAPPAPAPVAPAG